MPKKAYLLSILITVSTTYAAETPDLTSGESIGYQRSQSWLSTTESFPQLARPNIPPALAPYVQETLTPGNFRVCVTFSQYEELQSLIHASGLSFIVVAEEAMGLTPSSLGQTSTASTLFIGSSQDDSHH